MSVCTDGKFIFLAYPNIYRTQAADEAPRVTPPSITLDSDCIRIIKFSTSFSKNRARRRTLLSLDVYIDVLDKVPPHDTIRILDDKNRVGPHVNADSGLRVDRFVPAANQLPILVSRTNINVRVPHRIDGMQSNVSNKPRLVKRIKISDSTSGDARRVAETGQPLVMSVNYVEASLRPLYPATVYGTAKNLAIARNRTAPRTRVEPIPSRFSWLPPVRWGRHRTSLPVLIIHPACYSRCSRPAPSGSFFLGVHLDILDKVQPVRNSGILHHANVLRAHVYADAGALADRSFHLLG